MRRRLGIILLTFLLPAILVVLVESCGLLVFDGHVCDINFSSSGKEVISGGGVDTMTADISFLVSSKAIQGPCALKSLVPVLQATSKCADWKNEIILSSFNLSLDRSVVLFGDTVPERTDLFTRSKFKDLVKVTKSEFDCRVVEITIAFPDELRKGMVFGKEVYLVTLRCSTSDQKNFSRDLKVIFKK